MDRDSISADAGKGLLGVQFSARYPFSRTGGVDMPLYEYYCPTCQREVSITQTMQEHQQGASCPGCGRRDLEPRLGTFFAKTSRKS